MEPGFEEPPHIKLLVDLLEQLERGEIRRLCVSMPPRFGKTTLCSQLAPSFFIGRDPKRTVILGNHSSELASSFSRKAKGYIENPNWPFPKITLSEDSRAIHRWNVTPGGGGLFSVGVGSGITGIGADFLIIDDPINDALSETERNQAWDWFTQVAFPRCNAGARILVVSARLAMDDLPGRLAEAPDADEWRFVSLPAINQPGNELGLTPGEPLWERFGHKELSARREAMGQGPFESQYMQNPNVAAGGRLFRLETFGTWWQLPTLPARPWNPLSHVYDDPLDAAKPDDSIFIKITGADFAGVENTSTGGSYSAIVTIMLDLRNGEIYILDCERYRNLEFFDLRSNVVAHLDRHNTSLVVIETNDGTGGRMHGDLSRTTAWPIKAVKPKASKTERALQVIGMIESGKVFLPSRNTPNIDALRRELAEFGPGARYTDQVDALVWALLASRQYVAARHEDDDFSRRMAGFSLFG
jgi:predicted phage terminase large subunit-like protein